MNEPSSEIEVLICPDLHTAAVRPYLYCAVEVCSVYSHPLQGVEGLLVRMAKGVVPACADNSNIRRDSSQEKLMGGGLSAVMRYFQHTALLVICRDTGYRFRLGFNIARIEK